MRRILIIEDEPDIALVLDAYLSKAGYTVKKAQDGASGLALFQRWKPSLVLLDIILPDTEGWSILAKIREVSSCPIIVLTALNDVRNRLEALNAGADDYICKPFFGEEVVARVRAILRRLPQITNEDVTLFGSLRIDYASREVTLHGKPVNLTPRDLELLLYMSARPNQIFERDQLIESVWGIDYDGSDRAVDLSINRIRHALADWPSEQGEIATIRRLGYKFRVYSQG